MLGIKLKSNLILKYRYILSNSKLYYAYLRVLNINVCVADTTDITPHSHVMFLERLY